MSRSLKKDQLRFFGTILLIAGVVVGIILVRFSADLRQRAATSTGTAQFIIKQANSSTYITPNAAGQLSISATGTGQSNLDGFQLIATFTGTVPADLTMNVASPAGMLSAVSSMTDIVGGKKLTLLYLPSNSSVPFNANSATVGLGSLSFTAPASGTMTVTIDQATSKILQNSTGSDLLALQSPMTFNFQTAPVTSPVGTATPVPTIAPPPPPPSPMPIPPGTTCTFTYGCTCTDTGRVMQDTWTCPVAATATPTPTPVVTPNPVTSLTIKTKFAGITSNVGTINIKIFDASGSIGNIPFTFLSNGVYQAVVPLPVSYVNPTQITLAMKPEKHVAKVFRSVAITANVLDLTSKPFEPGDLPPQDGTVDVNDINQIITAITHSTQTATDLSVADVNYDGVVNAVDVGLLLSTLSSKPDESL